MNVHDLWFLVGVVPLVVVAAAAVCAPLWRSSRAVGLGLILGLLVFTAGIYASVGQVGLWGARVTTSSSASAETQTSLAQDAEPSDRDAATQASQQAQIAGMVQRLSERLRQQPDDAAGWQMLVRSYETLGQFDKAVQAWERLFALQPPNADQLTEYAVTLGMSQGQRLAGEPEQILEAVLKREPNHVQALALAGSAAFERHDYLRAIARWEQLIQKAPADDDVRRRIGAQIDKARELAAQEAAGKGKR